MCAINHTKVIRERQTLIHPSDSNTSNKGLNGGDVYMTRLSQLLCSMHPDIRGDCIQHIHHKLIPMFVVDAHNTSITKSASLTSSF